MKRIYLVIFILLFAMSLVANAEDHFQSIQEETAAKYTNTINALLKTTIDKLGNTRSSVTAKIGKPESISSEFIADPDEPLQDDIIHTLTYDGIIIWIYQSAVSNKEKLLSVRMTKNRKELLPELIGKTKEDIISIFGQPTSLRGEKFKFESLDDDESGLGILELEFNNSSVDAVELTYYID